MADEDEISELTLKVYFKPDAHCPECDGTLNPTVEDFLISIACPHCDAELYLEVDEDEYPIQ